MEDTAEYTVHENSWARFYIRNDEFHLEEKAGVGDCVKVRVRSREGALGAWTADAWVDGQWRELVNIKVARASEEGGSATAGHIRIQLNDGQGGGDTHMRKVLDLFHDRAVWHVPVATAATNALRSANGLHWMVMQEDGVFVQYRNRVAFDYSTGDIVFASNRPWPVQP